MSSIVGLLLVNLFQHLIDYRGSIEDIFKNEENKMRKNKNYKVTKKRKLKIIEEIKKVTFSLKRKIILFILLEYLFMLFFYYFVTAFCEVYKKTQISWLYDFFLGLLFHFVSKYYLLFL